MKKPNLKRLTPFICALAAFIAFGFIYCSPVLEGKVLQAGDTTNYLGSSNVCSCRQVRKGVPLA